MSEGQQPPTFVKDVIIHAIRYKLYVASTFIYYDKLLQLLTNKTANAESDLSDIEEYDECRKIGFEIYGF